MTRLLNRHRNGQAFQEGDSDILSLEMNTMSLALVEMTKNLEDIEKTSLSTAEHARNCKLLALES